MATIQNQLKAGILDLQKAFVTLAEVRQTLVVTAISMRDTGKVVDVRRVSEFESARRSMVESAYSLDRVMNLLAQSDARSWSQMLGAFNKYAQTIPGVNISSVSIGELVELAVPPIPTKILQPLDNVEIRKAVDAERRFYNMKPTRLGFLPALGPLISACAPAIAATAAATAGIGGIAVAVGCGLGALAIVAGTVYVAAKTVDAITRAVEAFNPSAAASRAEAERLKALADAYKAVDEVTRGVSPEEKSRILKDFRDKGLPQPEVQINWTLVAGLAVAAFAVYAVYVMPKGQSEGPGRAIAVASAPAARRHRKRRPARA